jgi:hypothetical protein
MLDFGPYYGTDRNYPVQYGPNYGRPKIRCQTVQDGATVQYDFDRNLAVWLQFWLTTIVYEYQPEIK